ncbi:hypothetical protein [Vibrio renipiscarius]|uniref:Uncharacterized protein n=1 Tax=Vibrio renipiscarius TaxID=1461322 RepID=A0A0C2NXS3_9VIBR|nr:hypothetical protein [Vibrio renipiscarius]KII75894.1 hypothetical protein OJ16_13710 [Vibrio renipiscarius]KII78997.1 hypothetical protein PL18_09170 [Vibrio renipiscarius]
MSQQNDLEFTAILNGYYGATDNEKRWKETCAALVLVKHTFQVESGNSLSTLEKHISNVANGIRDSLER